MADSTLLVRATVEPVIEQAGASLYDLELKAGLLQVLVERREGLDLDAIADLSRRISHALDEADPIPGHYTLEVSSPGLERPLRLPSHFAGAIGEVVTIKTAPNSEIRRVRGKLLAADDATCTVEPEGGGDPVTVPLDDITRARTVFEWGPAPKPGSRPSASRTAKRTTT